MMSEKKIPNFYLLNETQLAVLQDFISKLQMSWAQTNPLMQVLLTLPVLPPSTLAHLNKELENASNRGVNDQNTL